MRKVIFTILAAVAVLSGCSNNQYTENDPYVMTGKFKAVCIDGVEYWIRAIRHKGYLAARINKDTLLPQRCDVMLIGMPRP